MMMNKREMLLAQKAIQARQVKKEGKLIKGYLDATRTNRSDIPNISSHDLLQHHQSMSALPELNTSGDFSRPSEDTLLSPPGKATLSRANSELVVELAKRGNTAKTNLRLMNTNVGKSLTKLPPASPNASERPATSSLASPSPSKSSENFFMPKMSLTRADGATLSDIYESKKQDTWGQILRAQAKEDEINKKVQKVEKYKSDEEYGRLIKKQIQDNRDAAMNGVNQNNQFAALEDLTAKRMEDLEKGRVNDAIRRHKQFIANAVEDINAKKLRKEQEMYEDCLASSVMINKAKQLIAEEEAKKKAEKEYHRTYQERLYQENLESIERKQRQKLDSFAEDRRIIAENERQFQREQKRREDALNSKLQRSSEGPAHHVVTAIVEEKRRKDEEFYNALCGADNVLNKQLQTSEELGRAKQKNNGDTLQMEFELRRQYLANKKREDDIRNAKILKEMKEIQEKQEREDKAKKEKQRAYALKYQQDLDDQLRQLRQRSQDALTKTMSEQEIKYNTKLIKQASAFMQ